MFARSIIPIKQYYTKIKNKEITNSHIFAINEKKVQLNNSALCAAIET